MQNIYVVRGTEQAGPFTEADIRAQLAAGTITGDSMVWWEGLPEWTPLSRTPLGSAPAAQGAPVSLPVSANPSPAASTPSGATRTSPLAITSLAAGILGLPAILCWPIALVLDLVAIITGHMAQSQIKKNPALEGKGLALGGLICGYLGILLTVVMVVIGLSVLASGSNSQVKQIFETIQSQLAAAQAQATNNAPSSPNQ